MNTKNAFSQMDRGTFANCIVQWRGHAFGGAANLPANFVPRIRPPQKVFSRARRKNDSSPTGNRTLLSRAQLAP